MNVTGSVSSVLRGSQRSAHINQIPQVNYLAKPVACHHGSAFLTMDGNLFRTQR